MGDVAAGLRLALGTFTVIPVGVVDTSRRAAGAAMVLAPVAALPVATGVGGVTYAGHLVRLPPMVVGFLAVAVSALLTRCMHLDGLADVVDGLGSGWDRDRALTVMKRGDVGPMGAVALVVVAGLQATSIAALIGHPLTVMAAWIAGRTACTLLASGLPPVRGSGLGALMTRTVHPLAAMSVTAGVCALVVAVAAADGLSPGGGAVAVLVAGVICTFVVRRCLHRLGGINGDVFGAAVELATTVIVVVLGAGAWQ